MDFEKRFLAFIRQNQLLDAGDHVLLAVSGGIDSMVMAHLFFVNASQLNVQLSILHVNHAQRGSKSDQDERFVLQWSEKMGIPFKSVRLNLSPGSTEELMRIYRFQAFEETARLIKARKIALAHHLDDQVETFLMRFFKRSYLTGLQGIPVKRGPYIRPLLFAEKEEINTYAQQYKIPFVQDHTNFIADRLRNRVRLELLPQLQKIFGKRVKGDLLFLQEYFKEVERFLQEQDAIWVQNNGRWRQKTLYLALSPFKQLPLWRRRRIISYCFSSLIPVNSPVSARTLSGFNDFLARARSGTYFDFPQGVRVYLTNQALIFLLKGLDVRQTQEGELFLNNDVYVGHYKLSAGKLINPPDFVKEGSAMRATVCADGIVWPLRIRFWRPGDFFYPLGAGGKQKLKKFFADQKIDPVLKKSIPLVCNGNEIVWVVGYRLDDRYKITHDCKKAVHLSATIIQGE